MYIYILLYKQWKLYLSPTALSSQETFEIINNRQDLSEETYPPITEEEKEGGNLIRKNLEIFQSLFIKEECESPTHNRQSYLFNEQQQQQTDTAQGKEQNEDGNENNNESDDDDDSDNENEIKDKATPQKETPQKEEETPQQQQEKEITTITPNIKPKLEPLQPRNMPIISDENTENNGLTRNKLVLPLPRRLYKKHDESPKPMLNPDLTVSPHEFKQKSNTENGNEQ